MKSQTRGGKWAALAGATGLLTINFWAWSLLSPLASAYTAELKLSPVAISVLLATPVIIGSLGRIPVGLLADRFGARGVFAIVCVLASVPTACLAFASNYAELIVAAFCLGLAGASFAVGVPFVGAWFPKHQRGFALGLYAMGNAGSAVSGLLTPRLAEHLSRPAAFWCVATLLFAAGVLMAYKGRNAPDWKPSRISLWSGLSNALQWSSTRRLALLYAVTFGAFVAFGLYLPMLLKVVYHLGLADAAARAAGFILLATVARPIGGWLGDRLGGTKVLRSALVAAAILAAFIAFEPSLTPYGTMAYLSLSVILGAGNGAIFAILGHTCSPRLTGSVTGIVGAAGGLGGFFPPLVLGASAQIFHSYSIALLLLTATCLAVIPSTFALERRAS